MSWRRVVGLAVAAVALVATGCGDDDAVTSPVTVPDTRDETPTSTTSATEATQEDGDAEVISEIEAAYFAQWDAFVEILRDPDPANPLIDQHFAGAAKETLLDTISQDIADGVITRRPEDPARFRPGIESVQVTGPTKAVLVECTVDGLVVVRRDSGDVVNDRVSVVRIENVFELIEGQWRVTSSRLLERLEEAAACADAR
jgi:hypothetical protein